MANKSPAVQPTTPAHKSPLPEQVIRQVGYLSDYAYVQYTLTVNSANTSMGTVTGGGTYNYNATATLTTTPKDCYRFKQWSDGNTDATRSVTVTAAKTFTATFEPITYTITVTTDDTSMGSVSITE